MNNISCTLLLTQTGTVDERATKCVNLVEARRALVEFADARGLRINTRADNSGTLSRAARCGSVPHQAVYSWRIVQLHPIEWEVKN